MKTLWHQARPTPHGYRETDPIVVARHLGEARLVDVREPDELSGELGHIRGAELVPLATVRAHFQRGQLDEPLVLVCRSGGRSGHAASVLADMGFRRVINMRGGMLEWNAAGLPVERAERARSA